MPQHRAIDETRAIAGELRGYRIVSAPAERPPPAVAVLTMVSNLKYWSFKSINLRRSYPFVAIFLIVVFFALLSYQPATVLFGMFVAYALSGYAVSGWLAFRRRGADGSTSRPA